MLHTTLLLLRQHNVWGQDAPAGSYSPLRASLPADWTDDAPITLLHVLESIGIQDAVWALRATVEPTGKDVAAEMAIRAAERVQHIFDKQFPSDRRVRECNEATRAYRRGEISQEQLLEKKRAASSAAASSAAASSADASDADASDADADASIAAAIAAAAASAAAIAATAIAASASYASYAIAYATASAAAYAIAYATASAAIADASAARKKEREAQAADYRELLSQYCLDIDGIGVVSLYSEDQLSPLPSPPEA